jgi:nucleoside-diphosphate-sugar epimerase
MAAPDVTGEVFNVGCGRQVTLNELVHHLGQIAGVVPEVAYQPPRSGDVPHSLADISRARSLLNYEPTVPLEVGLRRTWEYFAAHAVGTPARRPKATSTPAQPAVAAG